MNFRESTFQWNTILRRHKTAFIQKRYRLQIVCR